MPIHIRVDIDLTPHQKRVIRGAIVAGAVVGALGLGVVVAAPTPFTPGPLSLTLVHNFSAGTPILSSTMNSNFQAIETALNTHPRSQAVAAGIASASYGTTDTSIVRFSSETVTGTAITSNGGTATNGSIYTINADGIYTISVTIRSNLASAKMFAILRNAAGTFLTTDPSVNALSPTMVALCETPGSGNPAPCTATLALSNGDTIRIASDAGQGFSLTQSGLLITQVSY